MSNMAAKENSTPQNRASNDWHHKAFAEFRGKTNRVETHIEYVKSVAETLRLSDVTSCLSVGPADGQLDILMLNSTLTHCRTYHATEPDECHALDLERRMASECNLEKWSVSRSPVETWEGPPETVDLVLLFHVLHYLRPEALRDVLMKCVTWTKPGGLIMIKAAHYNLFQDRGLFSWENNYMDDILKEFAGLDVSLVREDSLTEYLDATIRSKALADFILLKEASEEEVQTVYDTIDELFPSGRLTYEVPLAVFRRKLNEGQASVPQETVGKTST